MIPRIVPTPLAPLSLPAAASARRVAPGVIAAAMPGPGRDALARGEVLVVTTGQQPGLFTGPLYTIYKALSAIALARRLEREWRTPVVPVFWMAGDDHDFAEANHAMVLDRQGELAEIRLRERAPEAPLRPLAREPCGPEIEAALAKLRDATPDSEFKAGVLAWLESAYRPEATLADAAATALDALLGPLGLVILRAYDRTAKAVAAETLLAGLTVTLADGYTPVLVEAAQGRDRLRPDGDGWRTRRSGERFTRPELERVAAAEPERLSPNVLFRPVIEAVLLPSVAYAAGPAELVYLPDAGPLYPLAPGALRQAAVPRWSGVLVEARVDKLCDRYALSLEDFNGQPGALETRLLREALPPETEARLGALRRMLEEQYTGLQAEVARLDPTLERPVESAKHAALAATQEIEKKLLASIKRDHDALVRQVARARTALAPRGEPQERALTFASFLVRYGPALLDGLLDEVARWAGVS